MWIINKLLELIISVIDNVFPVFGVPDSFFTSVDQSISFFITILQGANYILPLDVFVTCIGVMIIADNFALLTNVGKFILQLIRG